MALRQFVLGIVSRLIQWTTVDGSQAGGFVTTTMPPIDPSLGEEATTRSVRLYGNFGFRSRPTPGTEIILGAPRAGTTQPVGLASDNLSNGPSDLAEGEVAIYSSADKKSGGAQELCRIRLGADGNIFILPKVGAKVRIGDSTDANLDAVALFTALKQYIDGHTHGPGAYTAPPMGGAVTGTSGAPTSTLPTTASSSNVVAKK